MSEPATSGLVTDIDGLRRSAGTHVGFTDWAVMTQERVDNFADVTDDHNFIHVDLARAKATPFGGTIAHGYLTLSLLAPISGQLLKVSGAGMVVNYGLEKVRFPAPLPVGSMWRGGMEILEVEEVPGGLQVKIKATVEVEGAEKPSLVAECLFRYFL